MREVLLSKAATFPHNIQLTNPKYGLKFLGELSTVVGENVISVFARKHELVYEFYHIALAVFYCRCFEDHSTKV